PVKVSRFPATSSAARPSRSAFVAAQVPCRSFGASSAGSASESVSPTPRVKQHATRVVQVMFLLLYLGLTSDEIAHATPLASWARRFSWRNDTGIGTQSITET